MSLESQGIIKFMRLDSIQIARQRELVTACVATRLHRVLHHGSSDPFALVIRRYRNIFNDGRRTSSLCQVVHDQELVCSNNRTIECCDEDLVVRVALKLLHLSARLIDFKRHTITDARFSIEPKYLRNVGTCSHTNRKLHSSRITP